MSLLLRVEMIVVALLVMIFIVHNINRKRLRIQYSFIWLLVALSMLAAAIFPGAISWLCGIMGIQTSTNLIYLMGIIALLLITFYQTILISKQANQITHLIQIVSIEKYLSEENGVQHDDEKTEE